jgi:hypothetical protein
MRYCECPFPLADDGDVHVDGLSRCERCLCVIEDDLIADEQRDEDYDHTASDWRER